jgi:hypothetical protein
MEGGVSMNQSDQNRQVPVFSRRLSQVMAVFCLVLIAVMPLGVVSYWGMTDVAEIARDALPPMELQETLLPWQRILAGLISAIPLAVFAVGLWQARQFFRRYSAGQIFSSRAAHNLSRFAGWTLASVIVSILCQPAVTTVLTLTYPEGSRILMVSISSQKVFLMFFAAMVYLMANIIRQGQRLAEENATIV